MTQNSDIAIEVKDLSKSFKLPHEQYSGLKQLILNVFRKNKKKSYEIQNVLDDINFSVKKGDFFGIVGKNGSGKSTLLKLLSKIYTPDGGEVVVNGSLTPFIELGVGFNQELTGRENVFMNGALLGFSKSDMEKMYSDIVEFAELDRFMDQKLKNYSSGMQVRLAFSIAIRAESDILVLDEVLAVGDAAFQQKCFDYFQNLKDQKKTVILVTHDMASVQRFCNKALLIEKGKIKAIGKPTEIADIYTEDNIGTTTSEDDTKNSPTKDKLSLKIQNDTTNDKYKEFKFSYSVESILNEKYYVGFSLVLNGSTVAEINNLNNPSSSKRGVFTYTFNTENLNPGVYEITATLFTLNNRAPIAVTHKRSQLIVKGRDERRGGAMILPDNWS